MKGSITCYFKFFPYVKGAGNDTPQRAITPAEVSESCSMAHFWLWNQKERIYILFKKLYPTRLIFFKLKCYSKHKGNWGKRVFQCLNGGDFGSLCHILETFTGELAHFFRGAAGAQAP